MENTQQSASGAQKQLFIKLAFILVLILFLLVPVMWIRDMIYERENLQRQVEEEIAWSWGRAQTVTGPVLCIPFEKTVSYDGKTNNIENHFLYLTPEETKAEVKAATETRSKGIFNTVVFDAGNQLTGSFNLQNMPVDKNIKYLYGEAVLITGISDPEAVTGKVTFLWNGEEAKTIPGPGLTHFTTSGFHNPVIISPATEAYTFSLNFDLRGTTAINFLPSGKNSRIKTSSNWPSPSFTGKNLPRQREISGEGFIADWVSNEYNRPFPDNWIDEAYKAGSSQGVFGVKLLQTADFYQKNTRSAKYAILVISLSFLVFFFFEMMLKIKIHPIQYILVGLSLAVFYALLLSLTEHIGFNKAYFISAAAVILLIITYAFAIIKKPKFIAMLTALFGMLYGYIFILLQLEDYALLAGAAGLFLILAAVMLLSRKVDWYKISYN